MCNCTEANLFNVGNSIVCLFYKGEKMECFREHPGKKARAHINESSWNSVLAVIGAPLNKHSWKPAHRSNKDKHSCQPPATLFKYHHTYLLRGSSYIHAKVLADWWLTQQLLILVCGFARRLWGLEAAHETLMRINCSFWQPISNRPQERFLQIFFF